MRITYACPSCEATVSQAGVESAQTLICPRCQAVIPVPENGIDWIGPSGAPAEPGT